MELIYHKERLEKLLRHFHTVAGLRIAVFDRSGESIAAYPAAMCPFCTEVCRHPAVRHACLVNDRAALRRCLVGAEVYHCHMGLTEAAAPILCDDLLLGYLMIGQTCETDTSKEEILENCRRYGIQDREIAALLEQVTVMSREKIESAMELMVACTAYILSENLITRRMESLSRQVMDYIDLHFKEHLTLDSLCRICSMSRSRLCAQVKRETGRTVGQLLLERRIREGKRLLQETRLPVSKVAELSGIEDYNYFSKVFRQSTAMTPSAWRTRSRKD